MAPVPADASPGFFFVNAATTEKGRRVIRDADNLVRRLTIELEIELRLGATVVPVGKGSELVPTQAPLRERSPPDGDAHPRCFAGDPAFLRDRFDRGDDAFRDQTRPAFVLARENEDRIAGPTTCLPSYIVFCARNVRVRGTGPLTSALMAYMMLLRSLWRARDRDQVVHTTLVGWPP